MSRESNELAVRPQAGADVSPRLIVSPIRAMAASSSLLGCAFGAMAAWTAHLAGAGIVLTAVAGHVGLWQRQWIGAAVVAPAAIATCLAAAPMLLAEEALHRAQEVVVAEVLAREPVPPRPE